MKELVGHRTLQSKTFDLGGGKRKLTLGLKRALHYHDRRGRLADISLAPKRRGGQYVIDEVPFVLRVMDGAPAYRFSLPDGSAVAARLTSIGGPVRAVRPTVENGVFVWKGIARNADCTIRPYNNGVKAYVALNGPDAPHKFTWEITGKRTLLSPITGHDAEGRKLELVQEESGGSITVTCTGNVYDKTVLRRKNRRRQQTVPAKYPLLIDPSVNLNITDGGDDVHYLSYTVYTSYNSLIAGITYVCGMLREYITASSSYAIMWGGLRFQSVAIPQGATIDSADITVYNLEIEDSPVARVYADDVDTAAAWSAGSIPKDITKTTAYTEVTPGSTGSYQFSVTSVVQEIINRAGWTSGNDIRFAAFGQNTGQTTAKWKIAAQEHATQDEAQLDIVYSTAGGGGLGPGRGLTDSILLKPRRLVT